MAEVKRKKSETFESLIRRFNKKVQESGRLIQTRKIRYYESKKNKNQLRSAAARREEIGRKREYLKKIGKLVEEPRHRFK